MTGQSPNHALYTTPSNPTAEDTTTSLETILRNPQIAERSVTGQALREARDRLLYPINPDPSGELAASWAAAEAQWAAREEEALQVQRRLRWAQQHKMLSELRAVGVAFDDGRL
jgi:hypothetical protein